MADRSPTEIRASIEANREQLGLALHQLKAEVTEAADWRKHLERHKREVIIGAAVTGFIIGGGIAGFTGLFRRGRRR
jgi:hypothetical protein